MTWRAPPRGRGSARGVAAAVLVAFMVSACGSTPTPTSTSSPAPESTQASTSGSANPEAPARIALVGVRDIAYDDLALDLEALGYQVETRPTSLDGSTDLVLFAVSAADGPMPSTRDVIGSLEGSTVTRAGVALTNVRRSDDPEIHQLVVLEMSELLASYGIAPVDRETVVGGLGTDLSTTLDTLLRRPPWDWQLTGQQTPEPETPTGPVAVPPLVNVPLDAAMTALQEEGLLGIAIGRNDYGLDSTCQPPVMELVPPPGTTLDRGASVGLLVPFPDPQDPALAACLLPERSDAEVQELLDELEAQPSGR